jgi:hypothetical protein
MFVLSASCYSLPPVFYNYVGVSESKVIQDYGDPVETMVNGYRHINYQNDNGLTSFRIHSAKKKVMMAMQMSLHETELSAKELYDSCIQYLVDDNFTIVNSKEKECLLIRQNTEIAISYHLYEDNTKWMLEINAKPKKL